MQMGNLQIEGQPYTPGDVQGVGDRSLTQEKALRVREHGLMPPVWNYLSPQQRGGAAPSHSDLHF